MRMQLKSFIHKVPQFLLAFTFCLVAGQDSAWVQLFNGKDINDWDIKFAGKALNVNHYNTFKVVNGLLEVDYTEWKEGWVVGHAANKTRPYSYYLLRSEYQVLSGPRPSGSPGWATQNNGLMLHSQSMASMGMNQEFPNSLEAQLMGPGAQVGTTMNLCTPGTAWHKDSAKTNFEGAHCVNASDNYRAPIDTGWNYVSAKVLRDSVITFYVGGKQVFKFWHTVYDGPDVSGTQTPKPENKDPLSSGYIAIQAESAPYRFRKIEVLDLVGCMDNSKPGYRSYFVKNDASKCNTTGSLVNKTKWQPHFSILGNEIQFFGNVKIEEVRNVEGSLVAKFSNTAKIQSFKPSQKGIYFFTVLGEHDKTTTKVAIF